MSESRKPSPEQLHRIAEATEAVAITAAQTGDIDGMPVPASVANSIGGASVVVALNELAQALQPVRKPMVMEGWADLLAMRIMHALDVIRKGCAGILQSRGLQALLDGKPAGAVYDKNGPPKISHDVIEGMTTAARWLAEIVRAVAAAEQPASDASEDGQVNGDNDELGPEAKALAVLVQHPDWSDAKIATAAGCSRTSLYRWARYKSARAAIKSTRGDFPQGYKDSRTGSLEAIDD